MNEANSISTLMLSGSVIQAFKGDVFSDVYLYISIVGAFQYATHTKLEIAYGVNKVCLFMHASKNFHWQAVKYILRYLKSTLDHGLMFQKPRDLTLQGLGF